MPVLLQGSCVVVLNEALDRCLPNGKDDFIRLAPNGRAYGDEHVSQCAFMVSADAEEFLQTIALRGIKIQGEELEALVVESSNPEESSESAAWLELFHFNEHLIGGMRGVESDTVVGHEGWDPDGEPEIRQYSQEEMQEKLEFVRREENIEVWRDKETGQELFVGRTTDSVNDLFDSARTVVLANLRNPGSDPAPESAEPALREAIEKLQKVIVKWSDGWQPHWLLGKAWHALDQNERAYKCLKRAYALDEDNPAISRELAGVCLEIGNVEEGVQVSERAVVADPDNAELICNLGVNYLFAGRIEESKKAIDRAIVLDANDTVAKYMLRIVNDVQAGKRKPPKSFSDLQKSGGTVSWLTKIFNFFGMK